MHMSNTFEEAIKEFAARAISKKYGIPIESESYQGDMSMEDPDDDLDGLSVQELCEIIQGRVAPSGSDLDGLSVQELIEIIHKSEESAVFYKRIGLSK